jgi:hypothetical protein
VTRFILIISLSAFSACNSEPRTHSVRQAIEAGGYDINTSYQLFSDFDTDRGPLTCDNCDLTGAPGRPGIAVLNSEPGTTIYSSASMHTITLSGSTDVTSVTFDYRVDTLPTETNDYDLIIGLCDTTSPPCNYGVWVELTSANGMWHCHSADDPNSAVDDNGPTHMISENTWENLGLFASNDGSFSSVEINGFSDCGTTSAVPTDTPLGLLVSMRRTAGASETFSLDFISLSQFLNTNRGYY